MEQPTAALACSVAAAGTLEPGDSDALRPADKARKNGGGADIQNIVVVLICFVPALGF